LLSNQFYQFIVEADLWREEERAKKQRALLVYRQQQQLKEPSEVQ